MFFRKCICEFLLFTFSVEMRICKEPCIYIPIKNYIKSSIYIYS